MRLTARTLAMASSDCKSLKSRLCQNVEIFLILHPQMLCHYQDALRLYCNMPRAFAHASHVGLQGMHKPRLGS